MLDTRMRGAVKAILVVDDDPDIRLVCRDQLEHLGYVVHCAPSGDHAIAVLSTHDIHAMILDLHLPGLGGAEVLRLTREQGLGLPVLLISASHSGRADELVHLRAAQGFLAKPFANVDLDRWVRQWVGPP